MKIPNVVILLIIVVIVVCSCNGSPPAGGPIVYPRDWPIATLKAPSGSTQAELKVQKSVGRHPSMKYSNSDSVCVYYKDGNPSYWAIGFHFDGSWNDATEEVKKSLNGYKIDVINEQNQTSGNKVIDMILTKQDEEWYFSMYKWSGPDEYYWHMQIKEEEWL